jgi:hypothetical protein
MFVLAVEVFTLSQALKTGQLERVVQPVQPSDSTINESLAKGNSEEAQKEAGR